MKISRQSKGVYPASPVHVWTIGNVRPVDLHFLVEPVVEHQRVGHCQSLGFHGVEGPVVEISDIRVVEVRHPPPARHYGVLIRVTWQ